MIMNVVVNTIVVICAMPLCIYLWIRSLCRQAWIGVESSLKKDGLSSIINDILGSSSSSYCGAADTCSSAGGAAAFAIRESSLRTTNLRACKSTGMRSYCNDNYCGTYNLEPLLRYVGSCYAVDTQVRGTSSIVYQPLVTVIKGIGTWRNMVNWVTWWDDG